MPLLRMTFRRVRCPPTATSRSRKWAVPATPDRAMVAPLPSTVTVPVMAGRPVGPSGAGPAVVRVYVHPAARVTVPPPLVVLGAAIADARVEAEHGSCVAGCVATLSGPDGAELCPALLVA